MNRTIALLGTALCLVMSTPALAHEVEVSQATLERDVTILAHDNMEGREAGTRGHERAAGYVAGRFAAMGLEPAGDDASYFQNVPMRRYQPAETGNTLTITGPDGPMALAASVDYYAAGTEMQQSGVIEGELVFIGYGLDVEGRDDFAGIDLTGKIAVRVYGGPVVGDSEQMAHYRSSIRQRLSDRGAIGTILLFTPKREAVQSWEATVRSVSTSSMTWLDSAGNAYSAAPNLQAIAGLSPAASRALMAGLDFDFDDLVAAEATDEAIVPSFAMGRTARIEFASTFDHVDTPNVVAMLPGSDPTLADQVIVLTGHLDHEGIQPTPELGDDEIYNGAMDNAVGIASMLEVARLLKDHPVRRPVLFVALTAEEKGLVGSSYNAANPTVPAEQVVANLNLDMPIMTYAFSDLVAFGAPRSNLYGPVQAAAAEYGLTLTPDPSPEQGFFTRSDQYSYVRNGIPAAYLDIGFGNGGEAAQDDFLNNHYHEPSDEVGLVDFAALTRFVAVNYAIARNIGNMAERPAWNEGDFFGEMFSRSAAGE